MLSRYISYSVILNGGDSVLPWKNCFVWTATLKLVGHTSEQLCGSAVVFCPL